MKKLYVQPEFDLLKLSSSEDILENSLDEQAEASKLFDGTTEGSTTIDKVDQDWDDDTDPWA